MNKEEIIKEFREKFVEKGGTENMWLWSLKGFHPNMVEDFWLSKLRAQNQDLLEEILEIIEKDFVLTISSRGKIHFDEAESNWKKLKQRINPLIK